MQQKVSGYWQTTITLARYCRVRSYLVTACNHGLRAIDAIHAALSGRPWLPTTRDHLTSPAPVVRGTGSSPDTATASTPELMGRTGSARTAARVTLSDGQRIELGLAAARDLRQLRMARQRLSRWLLMGAEQVR
jgi:hypothetical protein